MIVNNNGQPARARKDETLFLLLNTRAILIAYLNMKFVRLARWGGGDLLTAQLGNFKYKHNSNTSDQTGTG